MSPLPARTRRVARRAAAVAAACGAVIAASVALSAPASAATSVWRTWGADRYQTAVQLAKSGYPDGAPVVFLASGSDFPDALAAGPAAAKLGGPLLLTAPGSLPPDVAAELAVLAPSTVYVVGGTQALSAGVAAAAQSAVPAARVSRLSGPDRYATARAVVGAVFHTSQTAFIAAGAGFADALSAAAAAGSAGEPVLLVDGGAGSLDAATQAQLSSLGVTDVVIAGGPGAVSTGIESQLDSVLGSAHVVRLGGADRYATSALIGQTSFHSATTAYLASGTQFPDALAASAVAGHEHAPLFTVEPGCIPSATAAAMTALGVSNVALVGGTGALSAGVQSLTPCQRPSGAPSTSGPTPGNGTLATIAGFGRPAQVPSARGPLPQGVAVDAAGNLYLADSNNDVVEKVTAAGAESVVAGNGTSGAPRGGPATSSPLGSPQGVAVDASGNLYVADGDGYVEKVTASGTLSVVAGNGGYGAPAAGSALKTSVVPSGVAVDGAGNLYIADPNSLVMLKVTPSGALSIIAGNGTQAAPTAGAATKSAVDPSGVAVDAAGNVYLADWADYVEKVTPAGALSIVAGNGRYGPATAGAATASSVEPGAIAADAAGDVYLAGWDGRVVKVSASGVLSIVAGTGTTGAPAAGAATGSRLGTQLDGIAVDAAGRLYLADWSNGLVEKVAFAG